MGLQRVGYNVVTEQQQKQKSLQMILSIFSSQKQYSVSQCAHSKNPEVHVIIETDRVIQNKTATQKNDCEWLQNHLQNIVSLCIFLRTRSIYSIRLSRIIFKRLLGDLREEKEKLLTELRSQKLPGKIKPYVLAWHHTDTAGRIHQS